MTERQEIIQKALKENKTELLEFGNHSSSEGWQGSDQEECFATAEIDCKNTKCSWRDEDKEFHYLPWFGFKFTIGRRIISPFDRFGSEHIFMSGSDMTSGNNNEYTKLWLHLPDNYRFFDTLNAIRAGDKFSPFQVRGEKELLDNLDTPYFLTIAAYVERDEIHARIKNLQAANVESVIESFIKIYTKEVAKFRILKAHYQETDAEGARLWSDQELQSEEYYKLLKRLGRGLLGKLERVLREHGIKYQTSWSIVTALAGFNYVASEYGLPMTVMSLVDYIRCGVRSFFKSYEELRQERLAHSKARDKEQEEIDRLNENEIKR